MAVEMAGDMKLLEGPIGVHPVGIVAGRGLLLLPPRSGWNLKDFLRTEQKKNVEEDKYGNNVRCKMHGLMHDLTQLVARDNCFPIDGSHEKRLPQGARHVSPIDMDALKGFEGERRIRSLILIGNERIIENERIKIAHLDVSCFRNLRALNVRYVGIEAISTLGELKHLRSLDLSWNFKLRYLPNCIRWERSRTQGRQRLNELSRLTKLKNEDLTIRGLERVGHTISSQMNASFSMEKFALQSLVLHWDDYGKARANAEEVAERLRPHRDLKGLMRMQGHGGGRLPS
ncbi:hypothetical protein CRG98_048229 [Punica granatum]|uniref:R13L1/DRL21-like LRR repeat region domain-containing protein n=1 Tax=Punica granatum TaxID=22663 RepID=A0A2I0HI76_PUNGR|nr:hypothetical protein CRG98_048229 [Punica granatum]